MAKIYTIVYTMLGKNIIKHDIYPYDQDFLDSWKISSLPKESLYKTTSLLEFYAGI